LYPGCQNILSPHQGPRYRIKEYCVVSRPIRKFFELASGNDTFAGISDGCQVSAVPFCFIMGTQGCLQPEILSPLFPSGIQCWSPPPIRLLSGDLEIGNACGFLVLSLNLSGKRISTDRPIILF
jgi:hypothetical protein